MEVSDIILKLSPNIEPPTTAADNMASSNPYIRASGTAIGAMATTQPIAEPILKLSTHVATKILTKTKRAGNTDNEN